MVDMLTSETLRKIVEGIDNISEEDAKMKIQEEASYHGKTVIDNNYDSLLNFFKGYEPITPLFTYYMCVVDYERAKKLFIKIIDSFHITDINVDKELEFIRNNGKMNIVRCSDWEYTQIPLINREKKNIPLICRSAFFRYRNQWGYEMTPSISKNSIQQ
jgi:hypothetical protein